MDELRRPYETHMHPELLRVATVSESLEATLLALHCDMDMLDPTSAEGQHAYELLFTVQAAYRRATEALARAHRLLGNSSPA